MLYYILAAEEHRVVDLRFCMQSILRSCRSSRRRVVAGMKWRVDVSISTSSLDKIMKPSVMVELSLSDGSIKTFEMDVDQFQKLRYDTARLLRQMQEIERHPIMRIVD